MGNHTTVIDDVVMNYCKNQCQRKFTIIELSQGRDKVYVPGGNMRLGIRKHNQHYNKIMSYIQSGSYCDIFVDGSRGRIKDAVPSSLKTTIFVDRFLPYVDDSYIELVTLSKSHSYLVNKEIAGTLATTTWFRIEYVYLTSSVRIVNSAIQCEPSIVKNGIRYV
jgi:hypothetical protein